MSVHSSVLASQQLNVRTREIGREGGKEGLGMDLFDQTECNRRRPSSNFQAGRHPCRDGRRERERERGWLPFTLTATTEVRPGAVAD